MPLANNHLYHVTIRARSDGVAAYLDGKPLCEYRTDGRDVCAQRMFSARSSRLIAVGSLESIVEYHRLEVTPVTGQPMIALDKAEDGRPLNPPAVSVSPGGAYELAAADATAHGASLSFQRSMHAAAVEDSPDENPDGLRNFGNWGSEHEYVSWIVDVTKAGPFSVAVTCACPPDQAGSDVEVTVDGQPALSMTVESSGAWNTFARVELGAANLTAGHVTVALRATRKAHKLIMDVEHITLTPAP